MLDTNIITDSHNWTIIKGSIIADSAYQYILIGDFFDFTYRFFRYNDPDFLNQIAYYFLDMRFVSTDSLACNSSPESINEISYKGDLINIFPNPATNELTLDYSLTDKCYFELFDGLGAKRKDVALDNGSQTERIDLTDIDSGLYFYSVVDRKGNRIRLAS